MHAAGLALGLGLRGSGSRCVTGHAVEHVDRLLGKSWKDLEVAKGYLFRASCP